MPTKFAYRDAFVETWNERIRIRVNGEIVADHHRSALRRDCVINPLHSLELIARKHRSAFTAAALSTERIPPVLFRLRDKLIACEGERATKKWMEILLLAIDTSLDRLSEAVERALARGTVDIEAITLLLYQEPIHDMPCSVSETVAARAQIIHLDAYRMSRFTEYAS